MNKNLNFSQQCVPTSSSYQKKAFFHLTLHLDQTHWVPNENEILWILELKNEYWCGMITIYQTSNIFCLSYKDVYRSAN